MQTVIDATQKETAIVQQHSCETLICHHQQTILRLLSSAAMASTQWQVRELNCLTTYIPELSHFGTHVASRTITLIIIDTVLAVCTVVTQMVMCLPFPQLSMLPRNIIECGFAGTENGNDRRESCYLEKNAVS